VLLVAFFPKQTVGSRLKIVLLLDGLFQISAVFFVCKIRQICEQIKNRKFVAYWLMYRKKIGTSPCKLFFPSMHFDLDFGLRAFLKAASHL
jgi:hypothetical protein